MRGQWGLVGPVWGSHGKIPTRGIQHEKALPVWPSRALCQPQADLLVKNTNKMMTLPPHLPSGRSLRNKVSISGTLAFL